VVGGRDRVRRGRATRRCEGAEATGERQGLKERSQEWLRHQRPRAKRAGWKPGPSEQRRTPIKNIGTHKARRLEARLRRAGLCY
jgi:hypothetical protein